jgi:putative oxidoreductase
MRDRPRLLVPALGRLYDAFTPCTEVAIRVFAGLALVAHGYPKLFVDPGPSAEWFEEIGYEPGLFWAYAVGIVEVAGGLCLAIGLLTRIAAVPILVFLATAITYHWQFGFYWNMRGFEYPLFWWLVVFHFLIRGGGAWSVDAWLGREI